MTLVIRPSGIVTNLPENKINEAIWNEGCLHIRRRAQSVTMSVAFDRLTAPAIAAALYELADMRPTKICLVGNENQMNEVLVGFRPAFKRICDIFEIVLSEEGAQSHSDEPAASKAGLRGEGSGRQGEGDACEITEVNPSRATTEAGTLE
jgi:hypothetical protein